ncbi:MAG: ribbon-helix-helix domain-containing protein [Synergistaceae bacterium]|jgi:hypothetical protein|nr:ribbon-helix-helix domain-containing protein [Synergistaceae bacterium]
MNTVRWNVAVSKEADKSLRMFLASSGKGKKGDLSRVIEDAVLSYIFERTAEQIKSGNENMSEEDFGSLIEESIDWARHGS